MALFQDFPVGDWAREACATEFWKGKSTSIRILKCFPTSFKVFNSNLLQRRSQALALAWRNCSNYALVKSPTHGAVSVTKSQLMPWLRGRWGLTLIGA